MVLRDIYSCLPAPPRQTLHSERNPLRGDCDLAFTTGGKGSFIGKDKDIIHQDQVP